MQEVFSDYVSKQCNSSQLMSRTYKDDFYGHCCLHQRPSSSLPTDSCRLDRVLLDKAVKSTPPASSSF
jgi:hypothetical protein